jgi:EmrB/QacA subfamily drug resistance transporter
MAAAAIEAPAGYAPWRVALIMFVLVLATVLASLDSSFIPLAFTDMIEDLDSDTAEIVWVALGYLIAATGPMLLAARLADAWGHVRLFQAGTVLYSLAMIACAFAPDVPTLIVLRLVQGLGMALFLPTTFAIATRIYGAERRGRALGVLQAANAAGFILGPIFAGWLLDAYDWRATFASRIPLAVLTIVLALGVLDFRRPMAVPGATRRFDVAGAGYLTLALFGLLFGCNRLPVEDNHRDPWAWAVFAAGWLFLALFLRRQRRVAEPLVDLGLFRGNPAFTRAAVAFTAMYASLPLTLFVLPIVLLSGLEIRAWDVGFIMAVSALVTTVASPWAGRAADRVSADGLATAGALVRAAGYLLLLAVTVDTLPGALYPALVVIGLGTGLFFTPNNALLLAHAPPERAGLVSGLFGTLRQTGYAFGFAIIASLFTLVQRWYESGWAQAGFREVPPATAADLTALWDAGGIWSPGMLVFILRVSVVVCTAILLVAVATSWPAVAGRGVPSLRASLALPLLAGLGGLLALARLAPGVPSPIAVVEAPAPVAGPVQAFGMAARGPVVAAGATPAATGSFAAYCGACHGADGEGVEGLGIPLAASRLVAAGSVEALAAFIARGRPAGAPDSLTGRAMPAFDWLPEATRLELAQAVLAWQGRAAAGGTGNRAAGM